MTFKNSSWKNVIFRVFIGFCSKKRIYAFCSWNRHASGLSQNAIYSGANTQISTHRYIDIFYYKVDDSERHSQSKNTTRATINKSVITKEMRYVIDKFQIFILFFFKILKYLWWFQIGLMSSFNVQINTLRNRAKNPTQTKMKVNH